MTRYFTLDLVPQKGGQLGLISAGVFYANTSSAVAIFEDQAMTTLKLSQSLLMQLIAKRIFDNTNRIYKC